MEKIKQTVVETRYCDYIESSIGATLKRSYGSYGGGSETLVVCLSSVEKNDERNVGGGK